MAIMSPAATQLCRSDKPRRTASFGQVAAREAMETRLRPGDVGCELWNDTIAPLGRFQLAANSISNSPVWTDQDGVDRLKRLLARRLDELDNLGEYRLLATCQVDWYSFWPSFSLA
jgi:hypothetical protein